jgi:hypothetical protein
MKSLGRFYPHILISDKDDRDKKHKIELREAKFNFSKKANSNYKKAIYIDEHHKHKVL